MPRYTAESLMALANTLWKEVSVSVGRVRYYCRRAGELAIVTSKFTLACHLLQIERSYTSLERARDRMETAIDIARMQPDWDAVMDDMDDLKLKNGISLIFSGEELAKRRAARAAA